MLHYSPFAETRDAPASLGGSLVVKVPELKAFYVGTYKRTGLELQLNMIHREIFHLVVSYCVLARSLAPL
jgi:hypothetical protein